MEPQSLVLSSKTAAATADPGPAPAKAAKESKPPVATLPSASRGTSTKAVAADSVTPAKLGGSSGAGAGSATVSGTGGAVSSGKAKTSPEQRAHNALRTVLRVGFHYNLQAFRKEKWRGRWLERI